MSHAKRGRRQGPGPGFAAALPYRYGGGKAKPARSKCYRGMINIGVSAGPACGETAGDIDIEVQNLAYSHSIALHPVLQVVHASPRPDCDFGRYTGGPARSVPSLRHQAENAGQRVRRQTSARISWASRRNPTRDAARAIFELVQGALRRQDRHPEPEIRQHQCQLRQRAELQHIRGSKERRSCCRRIFPRPPAPTAPTSSRGC